jgi:hypothetical protein
MQNPVAKLAANQLLSFFVLFVAMASPVLAADDGKCPHNC